MDMHRFAIKYKRMAPIVIAMRMETLASELKGSGAEGLLEGFAKELKMAQDLDLTTGEMKLIKISATQTDGTIRAILCAYTLYAYENKPVCDMVLIDMSQSKNSRLGPTWR